MTRLQVGLIIACLTVAGAARADPASDTARAEALFEEGGRLLENRRFAEACEKLAESRKLALGLGVTLYLADCYAHLGRTATAVALFREAERLAQARKDKRESVAREGADKLENSVPAIVVHVAKDMDGLTVSLDDADLPRASWDAPRRVDPGPHTVRASAPGRTPFVAQVELPSTSKTVSVEIPGSRGTNVRARLSG